MLLIKSFSWTDLCYYRVTYTMECAVPTGSLKQHLEIAGHAVCFEEKARRKEVLSDVLNTRV